MEYTVLLKQRFISTIKAFGSSVRLILQARKKLTNRNKAFYTLAMILPLIGVVVVWSPYIALAYLIILALYLPLLEAYAFAVVNGG